MKSLIVLILTFFFFFLWLVTKFMLESESSLWPVLEFAKGLSEKKCKTGVLGACEGAGLGRFARG